LQQEKDKSRLYFGMEDYVQSINHALTDHLSKEHAEEPLAIGVFGAWGSGKTRVLKAVESEFKQRLKDKNFGGDGIPTIPVWFNPWRFEAEEHLIIPLLKTTEQILRHQSKLETSLSESLKSKASGLADAAIALGAGIKGKFSVGGVGFDYDVSKTLAEDRKRKDDHKPQRYWNLFGRQRTEGVLNETTDYQSIYFDINHHLSQITQPEQDASGNINLVFLIDDLDRCLPDKAVQVLESIKLFLDIPGCAFVLGMDEEVVDRGIAYRYRKYLQQDGEDRCPITGHEYLEKIIHLPFHLPSLNERQVREFLLSRFSDLFTERLADAKMVQKKHYSLEEEMERKNYEEHKADLLDFFVDAVPHAPRKLIRACELLRMNLHIIEERGWTHENQTTFVLTLAKLVLLQLFAPELYRFGKQKMVFFLSQMEKWAEDDNWQSDAFLQGMAKNDEGKKSTFTDAQLERQIQPLVRLWVAARHNRSGFDPDKLIRMNFPCDTSIKRYFLMLDEEAAGQTISVDIKLPKMKVTASGRSNIDIEALANIVPDAQAGAAQWAQMDAGDDKAKEKPEEESRIPVDLTPPDLEERAVPDDPQLFLDALFSGDALQMRGAFEQEKERLQGRAFAADFFQRLLKRAEIQQEIVDVGWVQDLQPYLNYRQLLQLYEKTGLLERLAGEVQANASE